ncbi:TrbC/VirB2 family protein [Helicobacter anatolicus]|uniref:TrbC/VirB2 family protein n=1 Tax=Helicobacter anatolicus TaxID=2905874 RepID=UPI001E2A3948|nr:TrbC/VirB2 family protein [Helicobacter anatolicus]MCE3037683.1 TrbC/VirB2 family protein [Helicobacter anatolicus]MCE3040030.1 TrbC/VirB2 family protein [Helicobacter anatolicus]
MQTIFKRIIICLLVTFSTSYADFKSLVDNITGFTKTPEFIGIMAIVIAAFGIYILKNRDNLAQITPSLIMVVIAFSVILGASSLAGWIVGFF